MTKQNNGRKRGNNRPTDPFGGPGSRNNTLSLTVVLLTLAFFLVLQWTGGDLGALLNGSATAPTAAAPTVAAPTVAAPTVAAPTVAAPVETRQSTPAAKPSPTVEPTIEPTIEATADESAADEATPEAQATLAQQPTQAPTATDSAQARGVQTPRATRQPTPTANAPPANVPPADVPPADVLPVVRASDLPTIAYDNLPPEAHETIALIEQGGPFPFSRDGITFQNRERLLPRQPEGHYREYTVITPGSSTRGARRIVTGEAGEMYYTDDHYESFREIIR